MSDLTREIFVDMLDQFNDLNRQLDELDARLVTRNMPPVLETGGRWPGDRDSVRRRG